MAFQQSTQQATQRISRPGVGGSQNASGARSPDEQPLELSRTWVLFSPPTEVTATSYLTETERSIQTPGRSRLSDLGSLNTGAEAAPASAVLVAEESQLAEESLVDDAELDSLDGHLPGFRSLPSRNQHIFPSHDGLGSFRLDQPALGPEAQDHLYEFERFNPRRIRRRLNSFEQAQFDLEEAQAQEADKRQRIENWRLEHSKILLEEIQRETRCRQRLKASLRRTQQARQADAADSDADLDNMDWHEQEAAAAAAATATATAPQEDVAEEEQSFLERITRVALRDLLDIDDGLLSILFGEEMVSEEELTSEAQRSALSIESTTHDSWQIRILERVSTELGLLVNQLSRHPGAFSTYNRVQQAPPPFAGLPVIPEAVPPEGRTRATMAAAAQAATPTTLSFAEEGAGEADFPGFRPTVARAPSLGSRGVLSRQPSSSDSGPSLNKEATAMGGSTFTQEEWERDVDIKLVFRYLVSRFTSGPESMVSRCDAEPPRHHNTMSSMSSMSKAQDAAANKAGRLRYHPLISRPRAADRRAGSGMGMGMVAGGVMSPMAIRHHSSCASQSTRRSARRSSGGSSRHYWDIGGSIKTGSVIASNGAMGTWGEG